MRDRWLDLYSVPRSGEWILLNIYTFYLIANVSETVLEMCKKQMRWLQAAVRLIKRCFIALAAKANRETFHAWLWLIVKWEARWVDDGSSFFLFFSPPLSNTFMDTYTSQQTIIEFKKWRKKKSFNYRKSRFFIVRRSKILYTFFFFFLVS